MDNNEARLLLAVYRVNGADAADPALADALRQAERDPVLAKGFAAQRAFDARMVRALRAVPIPAEGKNCVRVGMNFSPAPRTDRWWTAGLAACLALVFTLVTVTHRGVLDLPRDASLQALASHLSEHDASIGLMSSDYSQLTAWLQQRGGPVPANLPAALLRLPALGCQTWVTSRGKVSLVCFMGDGQRNIHLYVFENPEAFGELPSVAQPTFDQRGKWALASWKDGQRAYVLGLPDEPNPKAALDHLFQA